MWASVAGVSRTRVEISSVDAFHTFYFHGSWAKVSIFQALEHDDLLFDKFHTFTVLLSSFTNDISVL